MVEFGPGPSGLSIGDRVAVDPSLYCYRCHYCRAGRNNLCENWGALGVSVNGGAAEFAAVPAANCVRLPETIRVADAALIEPLSCAIRGYDVLAARMGAHVLIYGAGTMGLMMLALAGRVGAVSVDVVDVNKSRLAIARCGGTYLQFGVADYATRVTIEPYRIYNKEITITGSMAVLHSYERAAELFATGVLDPDLFITDRVPLSDYAGALDRFSAGHGLKIQVVPLSDHRGPSSIPLGHDGG